MIEKIPISGGPHTGKTTLLEVLRHKMPEWFYVPEPATEVIERELALQRADPDYVPRVPWLDYSRFAPLVVAESEGLEAQIPDGVVAVQDRSLIDTIAYCRLNGFEGFIPDVRRRIILARYSLALVCQPLGHYEATGVRRETPDEAMRTHEEILRAYRETGLDIIELPPCSVDERANLVIRQINQRITKRAF